MIAEINNPILTKLNPYMIVPAKPSSVKPYPIIKQSILESFFILLRIPVLHPSQAMGSFPL